MRETLDKLLEKLAVSYRLSPYETCPWVYYESEKNITCSAEVRMGPSGDDIEAEIQLLKEEADKESESGDRSNNTTDSGEREQILWMRLEPTSDNKWSIKTLRIKGKNYVNEFHGWEEKSCQFFRSCVEAIQMGELPDFDVLIEENMQDDSRTGGRTGRVGRKSPKIKPGQLMGMKK